MFIFLVAIMKRGFDSISNSLIQSVVPAPKRIKSEPSDYLSSLEACFIDGEIKKREQVANERILDCLVKKSEQEKLSQQKTNERFECEYWNQKCRHDIAREKYPKGTLEVMTFHDIMSSELLFQYDPKHEERCTSDKCTILHLEKGMRFRLPSESKTTYHVASGDVYFCKYTGVVHFCGETRCRARCVNDNLEGFVCRISGLASKTPIMVANTSYTEQNTSSYYSNRNSKFKSDEDGSSSSNNASYNKGYSPAVNLGGSSKSVTTKLFEMDDRDIKRQVDAMNRNSEEEAKFNMEDLDSICNWASNLSDTSLDIKSNIKRLDFMPSPTHTGIRGVRTPRGSSKNTNYKIRDSRGIFLEIKPNEKKNTDNFTRSQLFPPNLEEIVRKKITAKEKDAEDKIATLYDLKSRQNQTVEFGEVLQIYTNSVYPYLSSLMPLCISLPRIPNSDKEKAIMYFRQCLCTLWRIIRSTPHGNPPQKLACNACVAALLYFLKDGFEMKFKLYRDRSIQLIETIEKTENKTELQSQQQQEKCEDIKELLINSKVNKNEILKYLDEETSEQDTTQESTKKWLTDAKGKQYVIARVVMIPKHEYLEGRLLPENFIKFVSKSVYTPAYNSFNGHSIPRGTTSGMRPFGSETRSRGSLGTGRGGSVKGSGRTHIPNHSNVCCMTGKKEVSLCYMSLAEQFHTLEKILPFCLQQNMTLQKAYCSFAGQHCIII